LAQALDNEVMIFFGTQISAPDKLRVQDCETRRCLGLAAAQTDAYTPARACGCLPVDAGGCEHIVRTAACRLPFCEPCDDNKKDHATQQRAH
jgi:hypothetical protein